MGLAFSTLNFLLEASDQGASFKNSLTLGRTQLYLSPAELRRLSPRLSRASPRIEYGGYSDEFLKNILHIEQLESLDYSAYQGASIIHDMNLPIPSELEAHFDAVISAGTLEHIFNFPAAIKNCMRMVRPGGRLFIITVANNHCGHGFYQFSPELFFRLFNQANGFRLERLFLEAHPFPGPELSSKTHRYRVRDPDEVRYRVGLVTSTPVQLLVQAMRTSIEDVLAHDPQQSDYQRLWQPGPNEAQVDGDQPLPHGVVETLRQLFYERAKPGMPFWMRRVAMFGAGLYQRYVLFSLRNRKFYQPIRSSEKQAR